MCQPRKSAVPSFHGGPVRPVSQARRRAALLLVSLLLLVPSFAAPGQCNPDLDVEVFDAAPVVEGHSGHRDAVFRVRMVQRSGGNISPAPPPCVLNLTYGTPRNLGSATPGTDYLARGGAATLSLAAGDLLVRVPVVGDRNVEADEDFFLTVTLVDPPPEARLVRSTGRALIVDDDEAEPAEIEVVGEATPSVTLGQSVGLAVRALRGEQPVPGALVEWRVVEGEGFFEADGEAAPVASGLTGRDGVARQRLRPAGRPGVVRVVASLPEEGSAVEISVTAEGDLGELFPDRPSGPVSVADALDVICRDAAGEMGALCDYLFDLADADQRDVVVAATPRQAAAVGNLAIHAGHSQVDGVTDRLRSRRRAAGGGKDGGARAAASPRFDLRLAGLGVATGTPIRLSRARHADEEAYLAEQHARAAASVQVDEPLEPSTGSEPPFDPPSRLGFFVSGRTTSGDRPGTLDEAGFDADVVGVTAGLDYLLGSRAVVGAAAGWLDTGADFLGRGGELDGESWSLSAFGTVFNDAAYAELVVSGGRNDFTQRRGIELPAPFAGADRYVATADLEGDQWSATLTAGADRAFGALTLEGFARGSWVEASFDAYRERGAGPFDLAVEEQTVESLQGEAGVRLSYAASYPWGVLQPQAWASYVHEFEDDVRLVRGRFVEDVQALELVIPTEAGDADFANAGAGLTATFAGGRSLYVFYDRDLSRGGLEMETLTFGLRLEL